ncbi:MAG: EAL domain-containing protein [Polyangia bacterium]
MSASVAPLLSVLPHATPTVEGTSPRVLVVEDDLLLLRALARLLRASGCQVTQVGSGLVAAQMAKVRCFDVVLTDLSMPEISGLEVAARIREGDPSLSVVLMTGSPTVETAVRALELGALRYLVKPIAPDLLLATINEAAKLSRQRRAGPATRAPAQLGEESLEDRFAVALDGLWMAYQPIYDGKGELHGYEALVRSDEPTLANALPLLQAAERLRRVHDLGRRVRTSVAEMLERSPEGPRVFVNLHPLDLLDDAMFGADDPLARQASRVTLELTERAALEDIPNGDSRIRALRDLGFCIAVDDLGAGYAGLATLAQLSPEVVKLDMSLMRNLDVDAVKQKLVRMVAAVSHDLGATVVGEGIETAGERAAAIELGCDLLQGYLLGRPSRIEMLKSQ